MKKGRCCLAAAILAGGLCLCACGEAGESGGEPETETTRIDGQQSEQTEESLKVDTDMESET